VTMQRDMDLVRKMVLAVEDAPAAWRRTTED
jgi:hypothetical protein